MNRRGVSLVLCVCACVLGACSSSGSEGSKSSRETSATRGHATSTTSATTTSAPPTRTGAQWATYFGDNSRRGVASDGPASPAALRRQWESESLDGDVYAQPLLVGDRVVIATENDTLYSLDASDGAIMWKAHLGEPMAGSSLPCGNVDPVGITSTPVVDATGNRVYVVGLVQPGRDVLFEVDLSSGRVVDSVGVDAEGADPLVHNQRAALTLADGKVFVPYGGRFGDCGDYHGRVVSVPVSPTGFGSISSYLLPTQGQGGFWAPPGAAVAGDGSLYLASGNSSSTGDYDYGNSVVRLGADLRVLDSFAPANWGALGRSDTDLGSTGPVLLPTSRVFQVGKGGTGYLLDAEHLGGIGGELHSGDVCNSGAFGAVAHDGDTLYVPCSNGVVQVIVSGDSFHAGWTAPLSAPGPTIVAGGAVWTVATSDGTLIALDPASGRTVASERIGSAPSRFTSPAASGGRVVVAADRKVVAFGV